MRPLLAVAGLGILGVAVVLPVAPGHTPGAPAPVSPARSDAVVVLDAGHQLGNRTHLAETNAPVPAGGFTKPCNTTGSATDDGYPEATFAYDVTWRLARRLEAAGVRVVLTRARDTDAEWGPCVDERGRAGNDLGDGSAADLKLSVHADGNVGGGPGFHVIAPLSRPGWTDDIAEPSLGFARQVRAALRHAGVPAAAYIAGGDGLELRGDLATLNLSDVPTAMVELGNMRDPADAARMRDGRGRERYAQALAAAVLSSLPR